MSKPDCRILGFVLGTMYDDGLSREQIEFFVGLILDGIDKVKANPEAVKKIEGSIEDAINAR